MDKHKAIVIIAVIFIAVPFAFSGWNILAAEQIQVQGTDEGRFSFFDMGNQGTIELCNPLPFFVSIEQYEIVVYFEGDRKGTYSTESTTLAPLSSEIVNGTFRSDTFSEAQYLFMHYDGMFEKTAPERIDPRKLIILTQIETPIIGIIPYYVSNQYSGEYFWNQANGNIGSFNC